MIADATALVSISASDWVANTTEAFFLRSVLSHSRNRAPKVGSSSASQPSSTMRSVGRPSRRPSNGTNRVAPAASSLSPKRPDGAVRPEKVEYRRTPCSGVLMLFVTAALGGASGILPRCCRFTEPSSELPHSEQVATLGTLHRGHPPLRADRDHRPRHTQARLLLPVTLRQSPVRARIGRGRVAVIETEAPVDAEDLRLDGALARLHRRILEDRSGCDRRSHARKRFSAIE
jgi:hypothetical protein